MGYVFFIQHALATNIVTRPPRRGKFCLIRPAQIQIFNSFAGHKEKGLIAFQRCHLQLCHKKTDLLDNRKKIS
jgi:hypothetical protein